MQSWSSPLVLQNYFLCLIARNIASRASSQTIKVPLQFFFGRVVDLYTRKSSKIFSKNHIIEPKPIDTTKNFRTEKKTAIEMLQCLVRIGLVVTGTSWPFENDQLHNRWVTIRGASKKSELSDSNRFNSGRNFKQIQLH